MKGPYGKLKHLVRRHWECPVCHRRDWTGGQVVNRLCDCLAKSDPPRQTWMSLIEELAACPGGEAPAERPRVEGSAG